jgi:hypothetical protein
VDLARRLPQQEQAAGDENEVAPGKIVAERREHGLRQMSEPDDAGEHGHAKQKRERQAHSSCHQALGRGHARDHDRDEDDVIDPEHDLRSRQ